jgi:hypothetical protein
MIASAAEIVSACFYHLTVLPVMEDAAMSKSLAIVLVALCTGTMFSACATHEPAPSSTSQSAAKKKQQGNVGVGSETVNDPGRSDPSGGNSGASLQTTPDPLDEPGRADNE